MKLPIRNMINDTLNPNIKPANFINPAIGIINPHKINVGAIIARQGNIKKFIKLLIM